MNDSSFLFARPSFAEGLSRILDFGSTLNEYNTGVTPEQADYLAILADWRLVGTDIAHAVDEQREKLSATSKDD